MPVFSMKPPVLTGIDRLRLTITVRNMRLLTYIEPNISILLTQEDGAERLRLLYCTLKDFNAPIRRKRLDVLI